MEQEFIILKAYATAFNSSGIIIKAPTIDVAEEICRHLYVNEGYEMFEIDEGEEEYEECCEAFVRGNIKTGYWIFGCNPVVYKTRNDYIDDILTEI